MVEKRVDIIVRFRENIAKFGKNLRGFNDVMKQNMEGFKKQNKANVSMINTGAKLANNFRMITHGLRGFRMEMLGVMFFGMGMQRFFTGLLKPALQLVGVFELWSIIMQLTFLDTALRVQEFLLGFMDFMIDLPRPIREAMGAFVLFGAGLGTLLFLVGMLSLGLGSLAIAWGTFVAVVLPLVVGVTAIGAAVILLIGYFKSWGTISAEMRLTIQLVTLAVGLLALAIGAPFVAITAAVVVAIMLVIDIIKEWEDIVLGFKQIWKRVFDALPEPVQKAIDKILGMFDELLAKFSRVKWILRAIAPVIPGLFPLLPLIPEPGRPVTGPGSAEYISPEDIRIAVEDGFAAALAKQIAPVYIGPLPVELTYRQTGGTE